MSARLGDFELRLHGPRDGAWAALIGVGVGVVNVVPQMADGWEQNTEFRMLQLQLQGASNPVSLALVFCLCPCPSKVLTVVLLVL